MTKLAEEFPLSIPHIKSYELPHLNELATNKVEWKIDPNKAALLIHDMQDYFLNFYGADNTLIQKVVDRIKRIRDAAKKAGIPVFYTAQPKHQDVQERGLLNDMWGAGLNKSPELQHIHPQLQPEPDDTVLTKWRYSAFIKSPLEHSLAEMGRDQLIIVGVYAHIGCMISACDAFMRDIKPFMVTDAVADFDREQHIMALNYVAQRCGSIINTESLLSELNSLSTTATWTKHRLRAYLANDLQIDTEELDEEESLLDYGLDSIRVMTLLELWRQQGIKVDFQQLGEEPTVSAWWHLIAPQIES